MHFTTLKVAISCSFLQGQFSIGTIIVGEQISLEDIRDRQTPFKDISQQIPAIRCTLKSWVNINNSKCNFFSLLFFQEQYSASVREMSGTGSSDVRRHYGGPAHDQYAPHSGGYAGRGNAAPPADRSGGGGAGRGLPPVSGGDYYQQRGGAPPVDSRRQSTDR